MSSTTLDLPGVYVQVRPRVAPRPRVRTDVAGFIGFEPRLRPHEARLEVGPARHRISIGVERFQVTIDDKTAQVDVPGGVLDLSRGAGHPLADGESMAFAVVAGVAVDPVFVRDDHEPPRAHLGAVPGLTSPAVPIAPTDAEIEAFIAAEVLAGRLPRLRAHWMRLADVHVRREGDVLWSTVRPHFEPTACDDWKDYRLRCGEADDGMRLRETVRAFFANGGGRCLVATVRRPFDTDQVELGRARAEMVGDLAAPWSSATGLARLKMTEEVALVACPDLHARRTERSEKPLDIPPDATDATFGPCDAERAPGETVTHVELLDQPLYPDPADVYGTQRDLLTEARRAPNPVHVFLTPPLHLDPSSGRYRPPDPRDADAWRRRFATEAEFAEDRSDSPLAFGACYWPWLRRQDSADQEPFDSPPLGTAVGIVAAQDLERGPFVAPANRSASGVVGLTSRVVDDDHRRLHEPSIDQVPGKRGAVNVFRPTRTRGIELWGSRTLSGDTWFRHLAIRRGLSAIERRARAALADVVFEPNGPMLQLQVTQLMLNILLEAQEAGALRGRRPEESFVIRCDETLNTVDDVQNGRLICEVGVALAAPAEFIWFRLGRVGGAIEVVES